MNVFLLTTLFSISAFATDKYVNFAELSEHAKEGDDYTIRLENRKSNITVMAIHGGAIEPHSEEIASLIADKDFNVYEFIAAPKDHSTDLHLTSTHFDEPQALALAAKSEQCVSIHGFLERQKDQLCIGGANDALRAKVLAAFKKEKFPMDLEEPCARFGGSDPQNIVNRCKQPGLQLEFSTHLRNSHPEWFERIAKVIREVLKSK